GGGDPTVGLLPSNRSDYSSWSTAGLQSVGGIPNRTTIFNTISPNGGDDTGAIQAALNACPAGQVVQLTAGVFHINGNGLYFRTSSCTLRGAGAGNPALNTGINQPQLTPFTGPFLHGTGVENLFLWGGMGGDGHGDIALSDCAYCWVKNVQATWAIGTAIGFYQTFRSELRDAYIHESAWPSPGG